MYVFEPGMHTRARQKKRKKQRMLLPRVSSSAANNDGMIFNCLEIPTAYIVKLIKLNNPVALMNALIQS